MKSAIGLGVLATTAWVFGYSALAPYVQVGSVSGFALRIKAMLDGAAPVALAPILTLVLVGTAVGGVSRGVRGIWEILAPTTIAPWAEA